MTNNQIEVLFFSRMLTLSRSINALLADENDFRFKGAATLSELCDLWQQKLNAIIIVDLSDCIFDFNSILERELSSLSLRSFVFILDNDIQLDYVSKKNFSSYEVVFKPFRINDLFSKLKALWTNLKHPHHSLSFVRGNYFDSRKNQLRNSEGRVVRLTEKETKIISVLCKQQGRTMPRDVLLKIVWGYDETISTHTLETHIYRLRKKIELGLGETDLILKNNLGYFLNEPKSQSVL